MHFYGGKKLLVLSAIVLALFCSVSSLQITAECGAEEVLVNYNGTQIDMYVAYKARKGEIV